MRGLSTKELVAVAARFRLKDDPDDVPGATLGSRFVRWPVATSYEVLSEEITQLEVQLDRLVGRKPPRSWFPCQAQIGTDHAATLL